MKRTVTVLAALAAAALMAGCGSAPQAAQVSAGAAAMSTDLPDWYLNPPEDTSFYYGVGQAKMGNESRTQQAAENRARESVAFQVSAMVDAMQKNYTEEGGTDDDPAALNFFQAVNRQLASEVLKGARISKRWKRTDGTLFVLSEYPRAEMAATIKQAAETSASRLGAAKTQMVLDEMDALLAQKQEQMNPVDHD